MLALLLALTAPLTAQPVASSTQAPAQLPVTFHTEDGWTLAGDYRPPQEGRDVAVLIHGANGSRKQWTALSARLAKMGLGTLSFDLRGYGDSLQSPYGPEKHGDFNDMDWQSLPKDVSGAISFLGAQGIDENRVALIGSRVGANIAAMAAEQHPRLAWMVLLSPGNDYHGLSVGMGGAIDTLVAAGQDDPESTAVCQALVGIDESRTFVVASTGRGVDMLSDKGFRRQVLAWIKQTAQ